MGSEKANHDQSSIRYAIAANETDIKFCFVLENNYIHEGRIRYHSCMCRCCFSTPNGRQYTVNLEPVRGFRYDDSDESFTSLRQAKGTVNNRSICSYNIF